MMKINVPACRCGLNMMKFFANVGNKAIGVLAVKEESALIVKLESGTIKDGINRDFG